ncbi:MAG: Uma2 family endonuclease, partial [Prochlorothrix sp.]
MIATPSPQPLSPQDYLQQEDASPLKHEYRHGWAYAMAGTTDRHNTIVGNLYSLLRQALRGTACSVYFADIKVHLTRLNHFYYPDLLVTCQPQDRETSTYKRFPKLIVEVLSSSTEAFDRGDKFSDYQTLSSLQEYVLVSTKRQQVEIFHRTTDPNTSDWLFSSYTPQSPAFSLKSLDLAITWEDLYEDISFPPDLQVIP